jgi:hypothetical protein
VTDLPPVGLAAAMTEQRACSEVTIPALLTEMLCCSIASWMETLHRRGEAVSTKQIKRLFLPLE